MAKKQIKVGVRQGGLHPEFLWNVFILDVGYKEADGLYTRPQYRHLALQVQEMARENDLNA